MDVLGNLFGGPFQGAQPAQHNQLYSPNGLPLRQPLIGYGQRFTWDDGHMVSVEGCATSEIALWRGAHMLYRSVTPRKMRKVMSKDQRTRLVRTARQKLGG